MAQCVAILTPTGRDAPVVAQILGRGGVNSIVQDNMDALVQCLREGKAGALIIAQEALGSPSTPQLHAWLDDQPPWSDLPIILLTRKDGSDAAQSRYAERLGNVTMLERPFHAVTLLSAAKAALRARARQREAETYVEQLAAERLALAASEARYRDLFETIDEGFCIIEFLDGPDGPLSDYVHLQANAAYERHAGISNVVGQRVRDMVPDEAEEWVQLYREVLVTGKPIRFERELVATGRHLELAAFPVQSTDRPQVAVLFQDQTVRRKAELALRELNETLEQRTAEALAEKKLFADIVEGTDALVQVVDKDFRWLAINQAAKNEFERIFGVRPRVGHSMLETLDHLPEQRDAVRAVWARALHGEEFTEVGEFGDPGRDRRAYEMKYNTLRDASGQPIGAYQFVYDVTERLRDQERLAEATVRVHEMAKLETLGQLTGGVAHDFNNLLTPIVGALDVLRRRDHDARSARLINGALQSAERASTLVQRLLTFARRQHLEERAVDVGALVLGMRDLIQRSIGPHIPVDMRVPHELPAARIDPNQLELAVLNLAVNARDAMAGGGKLTIAVDEVGPEAAHDQDLAPGRYLRLRVQDTGMGMDEVTLKRAIEPFFTTKGIGKGTGLGLSMVHGLVAQSGGALQLSSAPGKGTTADLLLTVTDGVAEGIASGQPDHVSQPRLVKILLVDDEKLVRAATAEMLREMGHAVVTAASPAEALTLLKSDTEFDLLISDYLMPQMRGSALIKEARQLRPDLRALLITGYSDLAEGEAGNVARLAKPFREADLARMVAQLISADVVHLASRRGGTAPKDASRREH